MAEIAVQDAQSEPGPSKQHRPNPKVAVVVAGAALAVTIGLTALVIPYVRQAAKLQVPPQFMSHQSKARSLQALAKSKGSAAESAPAPTISAELEEARAFNAQEEERLSGSIPLDEDGEPLEPASPWLGFQALGVATAIVGLSAGLGIFGAAKYLGVNSMEEFAAKMRGSLEESMPEFVQQVRREGEEPAPEGPNLLDHEGEVDEDKLSAWVRSLSEPEPEDIADAVVVDVVRRDLPPRTAVERELVTKWRLGKS